MRHTGTLGYFHCAILIGEMMGTREHCQWMERGKWNWIRRYTASGLDGGWKGDDLTGLELVDENVLYMNDDVNLLD